MTKCKHKGECICGKHPKEEEKIVTFNGVQYFERKVNQGVLGELTFLSLVEYQEDSNHSYNGMDIDVGATYKQTQKPNQVHVNKTEKIKS